MRTLKISLLILILSKILFAQTPDTIWTKIFGGDYNDYGSSVQQTTDSGYIIVGGTESFSAGYNDVWLIKTNSSGDTLWTKTSGDINSDWGYSVIQTTDNGYAIIGGVSLVGGGNYVSLIKTDSFGGTLWTKSYGGTLGYAIQQTTDGGYIITGITGSLYMGNLDVLLLKTDSSGDTLWTKTFGGNDRDEGLSVRQTADSGYIIAGYTGSFGAGGYDVWLIKTDLSGDTLWTKKYGGIYNDYGNSIQETNDNGFIITGRTSGDVMLIKTDSSGNTLWTKTFGGTNTDEGLSVRQTADSGYIIGGNTESFGAGAEDIWLIKTDLSGDTLWTKTYGGFYIDKGFEIQQTSDNGYIIVGGTNSYGAGGYDVWLIKTTPDISDVEETAGPIPSDYSLSQNYPNPFNPTTSLQYAIGSRQFVTLKVYDLLGREVATLVNEEKPAGEYEVEFNGATLPSGIYFYRLKAGAFLETRKMVLLR